MSSPVKKPRVNIIPSDPYVYPKQHKNVATSSKNIESNLEKIHNSALKFLVPLKLEHALALITQEATRLVNADWAGLYMVEDKHLKEMSTYPKNIKLLTPRRRGFTYRAYLERKTFVIHDADIISYHPELGTKKIKSAICIPLSYQKKSIGALTLLTHRNKKFSDEELKLLKLFGSYASLAIRKSQLIDQMNEALVLRDNFLSLAAHELRTPLTSILGYIQLLHKKLANSPTSEGRWINTLYKEGHRLSDLVTDLLQINRIRSGQLHLILSECAFLTIIDESSRIFNSIYSDRKLIIQNSLKPGKDKIVGDYDKLVSVLSNLLDNAAKFSDPSTEIRIVLSSQKKNLIVQIIDKGIGVEKSDIARIFYGFYKPETNLKEGLGVGLLFAKYIIEYHQGKISLNSKPTKGTTVEIKLPLI